MSHENCHKITQTCEECLEEVAACFTHDEYFFCRDCDCRMPIDKEKIMSRYSLIFKKAFGEKPAKPGNN